MTYKYYSLLRPISMGTCPTDNVKSFANYNDRKYVESIGKYAWGEVFYTKKLKHPEDYDFEEDKWLEL